MSSQGPRVIDLEQLARHRPPLGVIGIGILILVGLLLISSVFFTVEPEEVGLVVRFGKYVRTADPGLNFKLPRPVEQVYKVPVQRQLKEEFGFRTARADVRTQYEGGSFSDEAIMLTGDLNVAVVEWIVQYRITDPFKFLFRVRNVRTTFRDMNEAIMRSVVGDRSVNEILTIGRQEIQIEVEQRLQALSDQYENGIKVEQIVLQDVYPPEAVKPSFNEVNQAEQERERAINEARAEYNRVIPRARGDAVLFTELLDAYRRAPEVTRRRIYLETMQAIYPAVKQKIVIDGDLEGLLPLLDLKAGGGK